MYDISFLVLILVQVICLNTEFAHCNLKNVSCEEYKSKML